MMALDRQRDRDRRMIGAAKHRGRAALGERRDEIGAPGRAVGVDDDGMNVVECDTADFLALFLDDEEAALKRQRSEEHTSELQSLMGRSYAAFCLTKKNIMN